MNKVTIEITSKGWKTILEINGEQFIEEHKRTGSGSARQVSDKLIEDYDVATDDLSEALNSFFQFDVMRALEDY
jgi:hypothetical protein